MDYGALIGIVANMEGQAAAGKITQQQLNLLKQQLADMAGIPLPDLEKIAAVHRGPSAMSQIPQDEALRNQQLESIGGLQDIIDQGGMTLDDKVAQEAAQSQAANADRRTRAGIASDLQQRGQLDSGANLVMQGQAAQSSMNANRQSGQEAAASAQKRKLQALDDISRTAGGVRGQDFSEAAQKASAQDSIDAWNAGAQEKAQQYNAGLPQQQFSNQLAKVTGNAGAVGNLANAYGNEAQGVRNQYAGYGQAAGQAVNGAANSYGQGNHDQGSYDWGTSSANPNNTHYYKLNDEDGPN